MNFEELKEFIRTGSEHIDTQKRIVLKILLQKYGKATKLQIEKKLQMVPPYNPSDFEKVLKSLIKVPNPVVKFDELNCILLDFDLLSTSERCKLLKYCNQMLKSVLPADEIECEDITWFREWLHSKEGIEHLKIIEDEKREVKELVGELSKMDRNSEEFTNLVLYGLLPYYDTKFAKRKSTFPAFMNIKSFFKRYNYSDKDWNIIAKMIFSLVEKFQKDPDNLKQWIEEFTNNKIHSRGLQCGSITPILFCINDLFPLINNKVINTYKIFANKLCWNDRISQKLDDYIENISKCQKLMECLGIEKMDFLLFDLFCWQYDQDENVQENNSTETKPPVKNFSSVESWNFRQKRMHNLPPPYLESICSIIDNIQNGKYAIPIFQREYTWTRKQVEELWESIFQGFFVGSILTWEYDSQIETIPVQNAPPLLNQTDIILDGQQRITSLFHATTSEISIENKCILYFVDLDALLDPDADTADIVFSEYADVAKKRGYLSKDNQFAERIFPMTQFHQRNYTLWLGDFRMYLKETEHLKAKADEYYNHVQKILDHVWFEYRIPIVKLPKTISLDSVAEIFEKINSKGTRLGVFDLLNARFTKYDINLRGLWNEAKSNYAEIQDMDENFDDAEKYVLQGLCLLKKNFIRRMELLTLDDAYKNSSGFQKEDFLEEWECMCKCISTAIAKLKSHRPDGFGAVQLWMTPYSVIIPILAALVCKIKNRDNYPTCMKKIECWYWLAVTSDNYSGSTDSKIEKDYRELLRWFDNCDDKPEVVEEQIENIDSIDINTTKTSSSIYKAIICLICKAEANDFRTGHTPEYSTLDDHHIFPKSLADNYESSTSINSILNRTVLDNNTNRKFLRNKKPVEYIKEIMQEQGIDELEMRKRLKTHLLSDDAFDCLLDDDFDGFVKAREDTIRNELRKLVIACP